MINTMLQAWNKADELKDDAEEVMPGVYITNKKGLEAPGVPSFQAKVMAHFW
jgi:hypothetical protein